MRSAVVIKLEALSQQRLCLSDAVVCMQVHVFILDRCKEPFDEYSVTRATFAVDADGEVMFV